MKLVTKLIQMQQILQLDFPHPVLVYHLDFVLAWTDDQPLRYFVYASFQRGESLFERGFGVVISRIVV
jgi:hypothetical protein